jgi:hypothetical protein
VWLWCEMQHVSVMALQEKSPRRANVNLNLGSLSA